MFQVLARCAAVLALCVGLWPSPSLASPSRGELQDPKGVSVCSPLRDSDAALCEALLARNCSLATGDGVSFCRAVTTATCSLIADDAGQSLCRGLTQRYCSYVPLDRGALCHAVVQRRCDELDERGQAWCTALRAALPPRSDG
ncbi:hypothetical protein [Brevundimonas fluminis]|jgi:hypothetical protein|uniref:hypothetical protein n=1 Tax=Brevundimonas fluminis TaxID=2487274 RepID=UPI000F6564EB|nr:hypothetical protein [Brevundimonas fluminis]